MSRRISICALCAVLLLMVSCKGKKQKIETELAIPESTVSMKSLYDVLSPSYEAWTQLNAPVSLQLLSPSEYSVSGRMSMVRDSLIHLSLRKFGIEGAIVSITPEMVVVIDKVHRCYVEESLEDILGGHPLSVGDIQNLLLGQAYPSTGKDAEGVYTDEPRALASVVFKSTNDLQLALGYMQPTNVEAGQVATQMLLTATLPKAALQTQLQWNFSKAEWNKGKVPQTKVPLDYRRISLVDILGILANIKL